MKPDDLQAGRIYMGRSGLPRLILRFSGNEVFYAPVVPGKARTTSEERMVFRSTFARWAVKLWESGKWGEAQ